MKTTKIQGSR